MKLKALQISPTRWCDHYHGFLKPEPGLGGYVRCGLTPDLRAQHPVNYVEIEADWETWGKPLFGDAEAPQVGALL